MPVKTNAGFAGPPMNHRQSDIDRSRISCPKMEFKIASRKALAAEINGREAEGVPPPPPLLFPFPEVILSCCIFPPVIHLHRRQLGPLLQRAVHPNCSCKRNIVAGNCRTHRVRKLSVSFGFSLRHGSDSSRRHQARPGRLRQVRIP